VKDFYDGLVGKVSQKIKPNYHQKYLQTKAREKFKEFLAVYQQTQDWPYEEIKKLLDQQNEEYFSAFRQVIEKSISNSENLISHRGLLNYLVLIKSQKEQKELPLTY